MLTKERARQLADLYISTFSITIFSMDPAIHDAITCRWGSLEKAKSAVMLMASMTDSMQIEIKCPVMRENIAGVAEVKAFADSIGANCVVGAEIFPKTNRDDSNQALALDPATAYRIY